LSTHAREKIAVAANALITPNNFSRHCYFLTVIANVDLAAKMLEMVVQQDNFAQFVVLANF